MPQRQQLSVLGRSIGTYTGWDRCDAHVLVFYDFIQGGDSGNPRVFPEGDLSVDYESGMFQQFNDTGEVVWNADIIKTLSKYPRESK